MIQAQVRTRRRLSSWKGSEARLVLRLRWWAMDRHVALHSGTTRRTDAGASDTPHRYVPAIEGNAR